MSSYLFLTTEFGVSNAGIHLLRSGFNYETILWHKINSIKIEKGKELHNWIIIFLIGSALLIIGGYLSIRALDTVFNEGSLKSIKMLAFLLIPCLGGFFIYNSLQTGLLIKIKYSSDKNDMFPLK